MGVGWEMGMWGGGEGDDESDWGCVSMALGRNEYIVNEYLLRGGGNGACRNVPVWRCV